MDRAVSWRRPGQFRFALSNGEKNSTPSQAKRCPLLRKEGIMPKKAALTRRKKNLAVKRATYPDRVIGFWKEAMRERIDATRKLAGFPVSRGDCHYHSTYSDGIGTVAETAAWVAKAGLDFHFITDHWTVRQKVECVKYKNLWWGQEPGTQYHHLGILGLDRKYVTERDLVKDYRNVIELGGFPFIPHPTGWFPTTRYSQEQIDALDLLGDDFTIELINGANNIFDCYDITDDMSISLWDRHLSQGKIVRGMGNTDAHLYQAIGDVWNGVLLERPTKKKVIDALWAGHFFASDAPFVNLRCGKAVMGDVVKKRKGSQVEVRYECADSLGLQQVRVIANGKVVEDLHPEDKQVVKGSFKMKFGGGHAYIRVECYARDNRKAFSNPIYIRER